MVAAVPLLKFCRNAAVFLLEKQLFARALLSVFCLTAGWLLLVFLFAGGMVPLDFPERGRAVLSWAA